MKQHTITNKVLIESMEVIPKLDGFAIKGVALLNLTKIGLKLQEVARPVLKVRDEIQKSYYPEGRARADDPRLKDYTEEVMKILNEQSTFEIPNLTSKDLNLEENAIPVSILMTLEWLIELE